MTDDKEKAIIERLDAIKGLLEIIQEQSLTANALLSQTRDAVEINTETMTRLLATPSGDAQG
jgi:hypothetical protein